MSFGPTSAIGRTAESESLFDPLDGMLVRSCVLVRTAWEGEPVGVLESLCPCVRRSFGVDLH